jgi:predicted RNase H-like HicB family nuclease
MYSVRLELEYDKDSGVYTVTSPDVPGLVTEGSTPEEINKNVQEALEGLLEVWAELNMPIPSALARARSKTLRSIDLLVAA